jgi:predicted RNA methylase
MEKSDFQILCEKLEHFETPDWAASKILEHEILTKAVLDPCSGAGVLSIIAKMAGYIGHSLDIHDWGYEDAFIGDFLSLDNLDMGEQEFSVFMNPPFSLAENFVEKSFELGARKIVCFQRFAWWESKDRKEFWNKYPPNRVYICADRASCWRHDIPQSQRKSGSPTAHSWFVWERGNPSGTVLGHIRKA